MTRALNGFVLFALLAAATPAVAESGASHLPRIVSLNDCLDEVVVEVADRDQILAISHYSLDPHHSTIAELAKTFPIVYETAEEIISYRPDVVLGSYHSSAATREALVRLGVRPTVFQVPSNVAESEALVRKIAELAGHPDRGEALVARIEAALNAAAPPPGSRLIPALVYQPNGFTTGAGTLLDDMLRRTGFSNIAADRYHLTRWGDLHLEQLLNDPPEVLLATQETSEAQSLAERIASHPALATISGRMKRALFPQKLIYCGGPALIESAEALAIARRSVEAEPQ